MALSQCNTNTLVFFDLEATGLPENHDPRITEVSFCAIERSQFLEANHWSPPRVTNRLNLCVDPKRDIHYEAVQISGLRNRDLMHQSGFDLNTAAIIVNFLKRLKAPVCLISHGGQRLDFPLIKSEIESTGEVMR